MSVQQLQQQLDQQPKNSPEYLSLLTDLAQLRLQEGDAVEAQRLFDEVYAARRDDIEATASVAEPLADGWEESWEIGLHELKPAAGTYSKEEPFGPSAPKYGHESSSSQNPARTPPRGRGRSKANGVAASGDDGEDGGDEPGPSGTGSCDWVVEAHSLNVQVTTAQLEEFLLRHLPSGTATRVKWLGDDSALLVLPDRATAEALLHASQSDFKLRPYSQASSAAREVEPSDLIPVRAVRPKTTTAVARRLIGVALQRRDLRDKDAEKELTNARKQSKETRAQRQQQLEAAWND